jgi:hypothetical protein
VDASALNNYPSVALNGLLAEGNATGLQALVLSESSDTRVSTRAVINVDTEGAGESTAQPAGRITY